MSATPKTFKRRAGRAADDLFRLADKIGEASAKLQEATLALEDWACHKKDSEKVLEQITATVDALSLKLSGLEDQINNIAYDAKEIIDLADQL